MVFLIHNYQNGISWGISEENKRKVAESIFKCIIFWDHVRINVVNILCRWWRRSCNKSNRRWILFIFEGSWIHHCLITENAQQPENEDLAAKKARDAKDAQEGEEARKAKKEKLALQAKEARDAEKARENAEKAKNHAAKGKH